MLPLSPSNSAQFDFLLALFRPLLTTDEVSFLCDGISQRQVLYLVEEGRLRAINIASSLEPVQTSEGERAAKRELRIYRYSVEHLLLRPKTPLSLVPPETIFSHSRPHFLKWEVASLLSCTTRHIDNLDLPGPALGLGSLQRNPRFTREGLIKFLTSREIKS